MFQFPGFAFLTLCIQVKNTWFTALLITPKSNNNTVSGGLPHSEIHGSRPILGSPWLIAEYHVFHRLLLPRHSPNALLALDLTQKKQDLRPARSQKLVRNCHPYSGSKAYFPAHAVAWTCVMVKSHGLVYLTWTTLFVSAGIHVDKRGSTRLHAFHDLIPYRAERYLRAIMEPN